MCVQAKRFQAQETLSAQRILVRLARLLLWHLLCAWSLWTSYLALGCSLVRAADYSRRDLHDQESDGTLFHKINGNKDVPLILIALNGES